MNNKKGYEIDFAAEVITITKRFGKAASDLTTPEFRTMQSLRKEFPDFKIAYKEISKKENKQSYKGLTVNEMEMFFASRERIEKAAAKEETKEELQATIDFENFKQVKQLAKGEKGQYAIIKKWFLDNFKDEYSEWTVTAEYNKKVS